MDLKIIFENDTLLVVDKPPGISVEDLPKLTNLGEEYRGGIVHRLDKDTSGVLLIAKTKEGFEFLQQQFQLRKVQKRYICLVVGAPKKAEDVVETLLGRSPNDRRKQKAFLASDPESEGKREAVTLYKVLEKLGGYTLLEVFPKTGRKHQIRAHMAYLGHPVAGDKLYGFKNQKTPKGLQRQFLHASDITLQTRPGEKAQTFHAELPNDLQNVLEQLRHEHNDQSI